MGKIVVAIIATILLGYVGIIIGAMLNLEGYLGIIFSIATMGAFILHSVESKKQFSKSAKERDSMAISAIFSLLSIGLLGGLVYLFVLIVKALRKYINSDNPSKDK